MSATATPNAMTQPAELAGDSAKTQPALVIDQFDYWHNQPDSALSATSITWRDPVAIAERAA